MKPFEKDLKKNDIGIDVMRLQNFLESQGYGDFIPTGFFGEKTFNAVRELQRDNKVIPVSGYFGPITRNLVNNNKFTKSREKLHNIALTLLGIDVTPEDYVSDEYACAETVCAVLRASGFDIDTFPFTTDLYNHLLNSRSFIQVQNPLRGDIIISPTGYGNGVIPNGHVGIFTNGSIIMSNNSYNGLFEKNYSIQKWIERYQDRGGYPIYYFRIIT